MTKKKTTIKEVATAEQIAYMATFYYKLLIFFRLTKKRRKNPKLLKKILEKRAGFVHTLLYKTVLAKTDIKMRPNLLSENTFKGSLGGGKTFKTYVNFNTYEELYEELKDYKELPEQESRETLLEKLGLCSSQSDEDSIINIITIRKDIAIPDAYRTLICVLVHELVHQVDYIEIYVKEKLSRKVKRKELVNLFHYTVKFCLTNLYGMNQE